MVRLLSVVRLWLLKCPRDLQSANSCGGVRNALLKDVKSPTLPPATLCQDVWNLTRISLAGSRQAAKSGTVEPSPLILNLEKPRNTPGRSQVKNPERSMVAARKPWDATGLKPGLNHCLKHGFKLWTSPNHTHHSRLISGIKCIRWEMAKPPRHPCPGAATISGGTAGCHTTWQSRGQTQ